MKIARYILLLLVLGAVVWLMVGRGDRVEEGPAVWETVRVARGDLVVEVSGRGKVAPARTFRLWSRSSSRIKAIEVSEGQEVRKDACLVKLEPDPQFDQEWNNLQRKLLGLHEQQKTQAEQLALKNKLYAEGLAARSDLETLERGLASLASEIDILNRRRDYLGERMGVEPGGGDDDSAFCLRAPFDGRVLKINKTAGELAMPGESAVGRGRSGQEPILIMADLSSFFVHAEISELDIDRVTPGQAAEIRLDAYPDRTCRGEVAKISPIAEENHDMSLPNAEPSVSYYDAEINLTECRIELKAGFSGEVAIEVERRAQVLQVPLDAVIKEGTEQWVYLKHDAGFAKRRIAAGPEAGQKIEVLEGLAEGDEICANPLQYEEHLELESRHRNRGWLERIFQ